MLWPFTLRKRRIAIVVIIFLLAWALLFLAADAPAIAARSLPPFQTVVTLGALMFAATMATYFLLTLWKLKRGAVLLEVDDQGFTLTYPDHSSVRTLWADPSLRFDLIDLTGVDPSKLRVDLPYSISVRGVRSLLTKEAYAVMIDQVARHGLVDSAAPGSRWVFAADANPRFHHIRAASHRRGEPAVQGG